MYPLCDTTKGRLESMLIMKHTLKINAGFKPQGLSLSTVLVTGSLASRQ